jgi:hypothetical protein
MKQTGSAPLQGLIYRASSLAPTLLVLTLAGCAHQPQAPVAPAPAATAPTQPPPVPPPPSSASSPTPTAPAAGAAGASADRTPNPPVAPPAKEPAKPAPVPAAPSARPTPKPAATNAAAAAAPRSSNPAAPAAGAASAGASLDLASLEQRLRDTHAIGVFTKLSLKNQVDDLLAQFRAYHHGQAQPPLTELRAHYELLLLKVITLLQDGDAQLAAAVSSSREAIWGILADPRKFAQI